MQTEDIRFRCPACHGKLKVDGLYSGRTVSCPKCSATINIPTDRGEAFSDVVHLLEKARESLAAAEEAKRRSVLESAELSKALDASLAKAEKSRSAAAGAAAEARRGAQAAAELTLTLDEAREALAKAHGDREADRVEFEEALKQEKATLALEIQAHDKREQEAEAQTHRAGTAHRRELDALNKEVAARTSESHKLRQDLDRAERAARNATDLAARRAAEQSRAARDAAETCRKALGEAEEALARARMDRAEDRAEFEEALASKDAALARKTQARKKYEEEVAERARQGEGAGEPLEQVRKERDELALKLEARAAEIAEAHIELHRLARENEKARAVVFHLQKTMEQEQAAAAPEEEGPPRWGRSARTR